MTTEALPGLENASVQAASEDLLVLVRQLRAQIARHAAGGTWAAPGGVPGAPKVTGPAETVAEVAPEDPGPEPLSPPLLVAASPALARRSLAQVRTELGDCTRCKLHATRNALVFGAGPPDATLMLVGEAPGEQEDLAGEPFVGRAGQLLDEMLEAAGLPRGRAYITNTLKCRPPRNRSPQLDELLQCRPFLHAQIAAVGPRVVVALGRPAANELLGTDAPISSLRGKVHEYTRLQGGARVIVVPTFHPAYLLREPAKRVLTLADLSLALAELSRRRVS